MYSVGAAGFVPSLLRSVGPSTASV